MEKTIEYLARKHRALVNDYRDSDGRYRENCMMLALETGLRLLAECKTPEVRQILAKDLIPVFFKDSWLEGWSAHQVCCDGVFAYDPLMGKPVDKSIYPILMFGENFPSTISITPQEFPEVISKFRSRGELI